MRNTNKIVALLLCLTLLVSAMAIFASAETPAGETAAQTESVTPNYTVTNTKTSSKYTEYTKSPYNPDNNGYTISRTTYDNWDLVDTAEGDKYVTVNTHNTTTLEQFDVTTPSGKRYFKDYPVQMFQFELIKTGTVDSMNLSYLGRTGDSGYSVNKAGDIKTVANVAGYGELIQVTMLMIGDADNNTVKLYTFANGTRTHTTSVSGLDYDNTRSYAFRVLFGDDTRGSSVLFGNAYSTSFDTLDVLDDNNNIKDEYSQFKSEGFKSISLPALATVDGVEYNTVQTLNGALKTADVDTFADVEFLAPMLSSDYTVKPITNTVINTNGFVNEANFDLANIQHTVNGNVIETFAENYSVKPVAKEGSLTADQVFAAAVTSHTPGNKSIDGWITNASNITLNKYTSGNKNFVTIKNNEGVTGRIDISFTSSYKMSSYPYAIVQFESGYLGTLDTSTSSYLMSLLYSYKSDSEKGNSGTAMYSASLYENMEPGEIAQYTVYYYATPYADDPATEANESLYGTVSYRVYRNGKLILNSVDTWKNQLLSKVYPSGFRTVQGKGEFIYGNVYTSYYTSDPRTLDGNHLASLEGDQFTNEAFESMMPTIATVNGVEYTSVKALNTELKKVANERANVEFLHDYTATPWYQGTLVKVDRKATVDTNYRIDESKLDLTAFDSYESDGRYIETFKNNYSLKDATSNGFELYAKSAYGGSDNLYKTNFAAADSWKIVTSPDGNQYIDVTGHGGSTQLRSDIAPTGKTDVQNYPTFFIQFEVAKTTENIDDFTATSVLSGYKSGGYYRLNHGLFKFKNLLADVAVGETAQVSVAFQSVSKGDAKYAEDGTLIDSGTATISVYVFVNGKYFTSVAVDTKPTTADGFNELDAMWWQGMRFFIAESGGKGANVAFDNFYVRAFGPEVTDVLDKNGNVSDKYSQFADPEFESFSIAPVALVDGEAYTYNNVNTVLNDGGTHDVELLHNPLRALTVTSNSTITTNGFADKIALGERCTSTEANGVLTVTENLVKVNVKVGNDVIATYDGVRYVSDHAALVREALNSDDRFMYNGNVLVKDGKYYELNWDLTKLAAADEITYAVTPKLDPILAVNPENNQVVSDRLVYTNGVLTSGVFNNIKTILYFNQDVNAATAYNGRGDAADFSFNSTTWELNGHTYNYNNSAAGVHGIVLRNNTQFIINNGNMNIVCGSSFFMSAGGDSEATSLTLNNVNINSSSLLTDWRAGTLTFNNCNIKGGNYSIGARTTTVTKIIFDGCVINTDVNTGSLFPFSDSTGLSGIGTGEGQSLLPNVLRAIEVYNSEIYLDGTLTTMGSRDAVEGNGTIPNNRYVYLENSLVYANYLHNNAGFDGQVIFGDNVRYTILNGTDKITAAAGVKLGVKTNEIGVKAVATKNYATVTWAGDNATDYWVGGSTPVAAVAANMNCVVSAVEAGQSYTFANGQSNGYKLNANLTLSSTLFYNFYADNATSVTVNGETIEGVDGKYSYELLAKYAFGDIYIVITFADGTVYSRTTTLMEYVNKSAGNTSYTYNEELVALYVNMVNYLIAVEKYENALIDWATPNIFLNGKTAVTTTPVDVETGALSEYFSGGYYYLDGKFHLVLNAKDGVSGIVGVKAGELEAEVNVEDGKLVITLPAYLLTETIEITIGDVTVCYGLANYANAITGEANSVATALYNYAYTAKLYEDASNANNAQ